MTTILAGDRYSLGVLIGLPIVGLILLACVVVLAFAVLAAIFGERQDRGFAAVVAGCAGAVAAIVLIICLFAYWPWSPSWHKWYDTTGTVQSISSRIISDGDKSVNQRFVVKFTDGRIRSCDDTRCSLLKPHDSLSLSCKRAYQWAGTAGWDCNYVRSSEDNAA